MIQPFNVLIVTGTRRGRADAEALLTPWIQVADLVIHGGADGVDSQADVLAKRLNVHTARVEALWRKRGFGAGPDRNGVMAAMGCLMSQGGASVRCVALPDAQSRGTHNAIRQMRAVGIEAKVL